MSRFRSGMRWTFAVVAAGLSAGSLLGGSAVPADPQQPAGPGSGGRPPLLLAQGFGALDGAGGSRGFPGSGLGQQGAGSGFGQQFGSGIAQGRQGGGFFGGGFSLAPGQVAQLAAFCTDLLSDPPDATTRFTGGDAARVTFADGRTTSLAQAMASGAIAIRGHNNSFDPVRRDGSLLLDLYLANASRTPARVGIPPATTVTPAGQAPQPLPAGADRLFAAAHARRLDRSNTMQYAVWAARGSSAEEVEQTNLTRLAKEEIDRVQGLLDAAGIRQQFDRSRGSYEARFNREVEKLGKSQSAVDGYAFLPNGVKVKIEGLKAEDGKGVAVIQPVKRGGEFYYAAEFSSRPDGRVDVKLFHLVTGRPAHLQRGGVLMYPS